MAEEVLGYICPWQGHLRPDGLHRREAAFAEFYVQKKWTRTQCAKLAGYPPPWGDVAHRLLSEKLSPLVVKYIKLMEAELDELHEVNESQHLRRLADIRDKALEVGNLGVALNAEKARGQVKGLYVERVQTTVTVIDQMTSDQLAEEIRKLSEQYPQLARMSIPTLELSANEESAGATLVAKPEESDTSGGLAADRK